MMTTREFIARTSIRKLLGASDEARLPDLKSLCLQVLRDLTDVIAELLSVIFEMSWRIREVPQIGREQ